MPAASPCVRDIAVPGKRLCGLTWIDGLLWFSDAGLEQILAVDPESGRVIRTIACPEVRTDLTHVNGRLVQIAGPAKDLRIIDVRSARVEAVRANPRPEAELCGIEADGDVVWMGFRDPPLIESRRWSDLSLITSTPVETPVAGLTVAAGRVAFACYPLATITLFQTSNRRVVSHFSVAGNPTGLTWDGQRFWYCDYTNVRLRAVDGTANSADR
jgi:hypothetical protein